MSAFLTTPAVVIMRSLPHTAADKKQPARANHGDEVNCALGGCHISRIRRGPLGSIRLLLGVGVGQHAITHQHQVPWTGQSLAG